MQLANDEPNLGLPSLSSLLNTFFDVRHRLLDIQTVEIDFSGFTILSHIARQGEGKETAIRDAAPDCSLFQVTEVQHVSADESIMYTHV